VNAADARRLVEAGGEFPHVAKLVADAPPLSDEQLKTLRHVFNDVERVTTTNEEGPHRSEGRPDVLTVTPPRPTRLERGGHGRS
jgi:hypothetical protein